MNRGALNQLNRTGALATTLRHIDHFVSSPPNRDQIVLFVHHRRFQAGHFPQLKSEKRVCNASQTPRRRVLRRGPKSNSP
jgi:hypothetical protein